MTDYTQELLQEAQQEAENMTAEGYLDLMRLIDDLSQNVPEARASVTFTGHHTNALWDLLITLRDNDEKRLWTRLEAFITQISSQISPGKPPAPGRRPASPAPKPSPAPVSTPQTATAPTAPPSAPSAPSGEPAGTGVITFPVDTVSHGVSNEHHFVLVKGGSYTKFGFKAWPEVIPPGVDFMTWPVNTEYAPPDSMRHAWINMEKKKVYQFAPEP